MMSINFLQKLAKYDGVAFIKEAIGAPTTGTPMQPGIVQMNSEESGRPEAVAPSAGRYKPSTLYRGQVISGPNDWTTRAHSVNGEFDGTNYYGYAKIPAAAPGDPLQSGAEDDIAMEKSKKNLATKAANELAKGDVSKISFIKDPDCQVVFNSENNYYYARSYCNRANIKVDSSTSPSPGGESPQAPKSPGGQLEPNAGTPKRSGRTLGDMWKEKARRQKGVPLIPLLEERKKQLDGQKLDRATKITLMNEAKSFLKMLYQKNQPAPQQSAPGKEWESWSPETGGAYRNPYIKPAPQPITPQKDWDAFDPNNESAWFNPDGTVKGS